MRIFAHLATLTARLGGRPLIWSLALCLPLLLLGCHEPASDKLVIGMELTYPPFEMTDEKGVPSGVGVEMAQALAKSVGREIQIENIPFDGLITSLKTGKINLIISSMTATEERAKSIDFSDPYANTGLALLVGINSKIKSVDELSRPGMTIAVKKATTGQVYAASHLPTAALLVEDKEDTCVLEVSQGKADAFIYDQLSIFSHWQRHQDTTRPILKAFQKESWAIGLRKGDDALRAKVNDFIREFRAKGGFEKLAAKYLPKEKEVLQKMGEPFIF
jgi:polar amino acid transport system substrate-binding protein